MSNKLFPLRHHTSHSELLTGVLLTRSLVSVVVLGHFVLTESLHGYLRHILQGQQLAVAQLGIEMYEKPALRYFYGLMSGPVPQHLQVWVVKDVQTLASGIWFNVNLDIQ